LSNKLKPSLSRWLAVQGSAAAEEVATPCWDRGLDVSQSPANVIYMWWWTVSAFTTGIKQPG
jgi:hypothetical protein